MTPHIFRCEQFLNHSPEKVFDFFKKPENLDSVTPKALGFKILTPSPIRMEKGAVIDYTIRLYGIPMKWKTQISDYQPPHSFTDTQLKGPYRTWIHTHRFIAQADGTLMTDEVQYTIPFEPLSEIGRKLFVEKEIKKIFSYRKEVIAQIFARSEL